MILYKIFDWVKTNFFNVIILGLILIIMLQRCEKETPKLPKVVKDTVWVVTKNTVITKPTLVKSIPGTTNTIYTPNPNYNKLVLQYQALVNEHTTKNVYKDSIKIDSIGYVHVEDTVSYNLITGRKTSYSLKYPVVTKTITLPPLKNNQIYYGGGLQGGPDQLINQFNAGILLKTKSDQIYNVYTGLNTNGQLQVGVQAYWKIKLKK